MCNVVYNVSGYVALATCTLAAKLLGKPGVYKSGVAHILVLGTGCVVNLKACTSA